MIRINPIFGEEDHPVDALNRVGYLLRFAKELQGYDGEGLVFTQQGREGFRFFLNFLDDTTRQIADTIEIEKNSKK